MSATVRSCASCGTDLPVGARFCASCGARAAPVGGPVAWSAAERRYFGVVPATRITRAVSPRLARWWAIARSRIRLALVVAGLRLTAAIARLRLHREASHLGRERDRLLHALGEAVYRDDGGETRRIRDRIGEVEGQVEAVKAELARIGRHEEERLARARLEGGPTDVVEPEPPHVPEAEPVPHEPPGPVIVPEPEPAPHEPPGPVIVPEPQPPTE